MQDFLKDLGVNQRPILKLDSENGKGIVDTIYLVHKRD
jgi:hypothetical protein